MIGVKQHPAALALVTDLYKQDHDSKIDCTNEPSYTSSSLYVDHTKLSCSNGLAVWPGLQQRMIASCPFDSMLFHIMTRMVCAALIHR
jgi:hypothetical protein